MNKINMVMVGLEEGLALEGGHRSSMIANCLSRSPLVKKVLIITCPIFFLKRMAAGYKKETDTNPVIAKTSRISLSRLSSKLYVAKLTSFFPESNNVFSKIDRVILAKKILWAIRQLGITDYVLWVDNPRVIDVAKKIHGRLCIFDAIDNLILHPQMKRFINKIKLAYEWVDNNANMIIVATEEQKKMFSSKSIIEYMPNGVDEIFYENLPGDFRPSDLRNIRTPIVGYSGSLQERVDVELVTGAVRVLQNHSFVFIGPELRPDIFKNLKQYSNVFFMGKRKYRDIPAYIKSFDTCIIPHKVNDFTKSMDPLKIYEYMACGKPIVASSIAGIERFKKYIYVADTCNEFVHAIEKSIREDNVDLRYERINVASKNSWDIRISSILAKIRALAK